MWNSLRLSSDVCGIPGLLHGCWDPSSYPRVCMEVILRVMPPLQSIFLITKSHMHEIKCVLIGLLLSSGSNFCVLNYRNSDTDNGV